MRIPYLPLLKMSSTAISSSSSSSSSSTIDTYVIGLNAALQKRFVIDSIKEKDEDIIPGNVYRASSISYGVGGKGQDVAYTLNCLQYHSGVSRDDDTAEQQEEQQTPPFHLVQFIGTGYEGDMVYNKMSKDFLSSVSATCLSATTVRTTSILRTCTSIVTQASTTELIDPSGIIASEEIIELLDKIQQTASASSLSSTSSTNNIQSMCFMGSMPPGCSSDLYSKIYHTIVTAATDTASPPQHRQVLCFIDSVVGLNELLQQISHTSSPATTTTSTTSTILKINVAELCRYVNVPIQKESDGVRIESVVDAMSQFWQQQQQLLQSSLVTTPRQPNVIALTNGAHPAYLAVLKSPPESSSLPLSFDLYRLPIASPFSVDSDDCSGSNNNNNNYDPHSSTLYPIGAGDAVAAGTFAAWNYYVATSSSKTSDDTTGRDQIKNDPVLPQAIRDALDHDRTMWHQNETNSATTQVDNDELYISCFRFGLACGSASCRQEENSIVSVPHVLQLFKNDNNNNNNDPAVAYSTKSTHSIPINVSAVTATSVV